jgi:hypothetical protein
MLITKSEEKTIVVVEDKDDNISYINRIRGHEIHMLIMTKKAFANEMLRDIFFPALTAVNGSLIIV